MKNNSVHLLKTVKVNFHAVLNKDEGGLNVLHLRTQDKVLKISLLHKVLNTTFDDNLFKQINNMIYGRLKYILTCKLSQEDFIFF